MINFRYHVVSLISVFLALAVGIILGAGPLKESIGNQLSGQVSSLRTEKEQLRTELDDARTAADRGSTALAAVAPTVLDGVLPDSQVTVVEVSPDLDDEFKAVSTQLKAAGAVVRGRIRLESAWLTESGADARKQGVDAALAAGLPLDTTASEEKQLAQALSLSLTMSTSATDHQLAAAARTTLKALADAKLITVERTPSVASTALLVLAGSADSQPAVDGTAAPTDAKALAFAQAREEELVSALHTSEPATVVAGPTGESDSLVAAVRHDGDLQVAVSTVSGISTLIGQVSVPLAIADQAQGTVGHYGFDDGATQAMPPRPDATSTDSAKG
ncbi:copper transporter [Luteimicrobium sp. DT211]|uniref:copper transporter n=1 Tax=Luteimicrobium sp. DT211 TaxID=3393412 RepID=UPI003CFA1192